jgi:hypothetical protein
VGRQQETFAGNEAQQEAGAVAHAMPDLVTVPLADGPTLDARTTQVWHRSHVERALAAVVEEHRKRKADFSEQLSQLRQARAAMD